MRINPLQFKKFTQFPQLEFAFGGTEANVSISLSKLGFEASHVSVFSNDFIGEAALNYLRSYGVNTRHIICSDSPMGIYFLEEGAVHRSSKISYNRAHSAFALLENNFDWENILNGSEYFHWTGVTAGISQNVFNELKQALRSARKKGSQITADISYRKNQWQFGKTPEDGLSELILNSTYLISGIPEMQQILGDHTDDDFLSNATKIMARFSNLELIVDKQRESKNASQHSITGRIFNGESVIESKELEITHIIDRIGTGDAFAAGFIYAISNYKDLQKVINFAAAACALKHTIPEDANLSGLQDILQLMEGNNTGRIQR